MFLFSHLKSYETHVKMSKRGHELMNDKQLASKVIDTIMSHKTELDNGKVVSVESGSHELKVGSVTSIPDIALEK